MRPNIFLNNDCFFLLGFALGTRRIDRALGEATNILAEGRRGVPHIVVLVAAGKQTGGLPLDDALEPLHKQGVHTFVVAIGHDPETSADIQKVPSFNDLPLRAYQIARHIKSESGKYTVDKNRCTVKIRIKFCFGVVFIVAVFPFCLGFELIFVLFLFCLFVVVFVFIKCSALLFICGWSTVPCI